MAFITTPITRLPLRPQFHFSTNTRPILTPCRRLRLQPVSLLSTTDLSDDPPIESRDESAISLATANPEDLSPADSPLPSVAQPNPSRRFILIALGLAAAVFLTRSLPIASFFATANAHVSRLGVVRGALLVACVNFCTVLFCFPANMGLMIGAGAVLGPLPAFVALFTSKLLAASVAFVLAKGILYDRARNWLATYPKLSKLLLESGKEGGWKFVLLMRLSPFPGFLLNYLLSVTGVSYFNYIIATMIGIAPSISNLVLVGATAKDVSVGVSGGAVHGGWFSVAMKLLCTLSMIIVMVVVTRKARRAFADLDDGDTLAAGEA